MQTQLHKQPSRLVLTAATQATILGVTGGLYVIFIHRIRGIESELQLNLQAQNAGVLHRRQRIVTRMKHWEAVTRVAVRLQLCQLGTAVDQTPNCRSFCSIGSSD